MTGTLSSLDEKARKILSVLSNRDTLLIFNLASDGISASLSTLESYKFSKKRYYTRLKELLNLGLIFKDRGMYKHTALGALVFENEVEGLRRILLNRNSIEILQGLKDRAKDYGELSSIDKISHEVLKELESRHGLSGLRPVCLFRSWDELSGEVAESIERMRSEMYVASRYVDFRTAESALRSASRGCKVHIIHSSRSGLPTRLMVLGNLMAHPKSLKAFYDLARNPNVSMKQAEIPYSFIVIDGLDVGIEIVDPLDPHSFFLGLKFESPTLAQRLISYFNDLWKSGVKDPMVAMFESPIEELLKLSSEG